MGGDDAVFPMTTLQLQSHLASASPEAKRAVLETLARRYWKPVYHFVRLSFAKTNEDSKDLTQAFFAWLLERDLMARFDPSRSSFRTFLKGVLRNFAGNEWQAERRLKRGGGASPVPIDTADAAAHGEEPDDAFDRLWLRGVLDGAIRRVRARYEKRMRLVPYLVFEKLHFGTEDPPPSYDALASQFGIKESDVRNYLFEVRKAVREEVTADLAGSGDSDLDIDTLGDVLSA